MAAAHNLFLMCTFLNTVYSESDYTPLFSMVFQIASYPFHHYRGLGVDYWENGVWMFDSTTDFFFFF